MAQNHVLPHRLAKGRFVGGQTKPILESQFSWNLTTCSLASGLGSCSLSNSVTLSSDPGILCEVGSLGKPWPMALVLGSLPTFPQVLAVSPWAGHKIPSVLQCLELLGLNK